MQNWNLITATQFNLQEYANHTIIVPLFNNLKLSEYIKSIDFTLTANHSQHSIQQVLHNGQLWITVDCGDHLQFDIFKLQSITKKVTKYLQQYCAQHKIVSLLSLAPLAGYTAQDATMQSLIATNHALYSFDELKTKAQPTTLDLTFVIPETAPKEIDFAYTIADMQNFVRDLGNMPANICNPEYLAQQAQQVAQEAKNLKCIVIDEKEIEKLGMGAFMAVSRGSSNSGKLVILEYNNNGKEAPVLLVGKGITFDTGGYSLKNPTAMQGMKYDMLGAANVLAVMRAAAKLQLKINLVGAMACAENMISGHATRVDDVVTSLSGQTIEITNTDAEGRLVLCDTLTYCKRFNPSTVIDIATLTGACVVALGNHASGLMSNNQELANALIASGNAIGDRCWQLPLWDEYYEGINSNSADIKNAYGDRMAGSITAGKFLEKFAGDFNAWAHLDIAGSGGEPNLGGATGRPAALLVEYLRLQAAH